jgi:hypothetical protein
MASKAKEVSDTTEAASVKAAPDQTSGNKTVLENGTQEPSPTPDAPKRKQPLITFGENNELIVGYVDGQSPFGSSDDRFIRGLFSQIGNAASKGAKVDEAATGFALSVLEGIKPRDEVEAMLAAQMAAMHMATMTFARRLNHVENIDQQDSAEKTFNKLARTFTMQIDALKKYRSSGEQRITVQHVTVNDGGQAVVGTINHSGRVGETEGGGDG